MIVTAFICTYAVMLFPIMFARNTYGFEVFFMIAAFSVTLFIGFIACFTAGRLFCGNINKVMAKRADYSVFLADFVGSFRIREQFSALSSAMIIGNIPFFCTGRFLCFDEFQIMPGRNILLSDVSSAVFAWIGCPSICCTGCFIS